MNNDTDMLTAQSFKSMLANLPAYCTDETVDDIASLADGAFEVGVLAYDDHRQVIGQCARIRQRC